MQLDIVSEFHVLILCQTFEIKSLRSKFLDKISLNTSKVCPLENLLVDSNTSRIDHCPCYLHWEGIHFGKALLTLRGLFNYKHNNKDLVKLIASSRSSAFNHNVK